MPDVMRSASPPAPNRPPYNVHYGAGFTVGEGWLNFDASPSLWLQRLPGIGKVVRIDGRRFPEALRLGDIIRGLPVPPGSAKAVYASHVLEHLSYDDCLIALRNTFDMLAPGGVFRLVVPDLRARVDLYLKSAAAGDPEAANDLCRSTLLGQTQRPRGVMGSIRSLLGNSKHLWMWDEASMRGALADAGFTDIRPCRFGDAEDPAFAAVEAADRFYDDVWHIHELAIEARRPLTNLPPSDT